MSYISKCQYLVSGDVKLFTLVSLPKEGGKFPTVIYRTPYVDSEIPLSEEEIINVREEYFSAWLKSGYAVVFQHCRGRGKSEGDCIPYINEREDGLALQAWVREQDFYNGEIFLYGGSYTASVHYVTAPFADDIKGAVLAIQDSERYNCNYRNGFYKIGLHGNWYVKMYKRNSNLKKYYTPDSYRMLPLSDFTKTVFGERVADFDEILKHPDKNDEFWTTRFGGGETHGVIKAIEIPVLLVTGFYDIYTGGVYDMWQALGAETRSKSALAVHPFGHGWVGDKEPINFENGNIKCEYENFEVRWCDAIRGKCDPPFEKGKITYYKLFDGKWCTDDFYDSNEKIKVKLGTDSVTYKYNPYAPASFEGGLSTNFTGNEWQSAPGTRYDVVTVYTPEFEKDTYVKGKISASLKVKSDCEDTCFYMRLSLCKEEGDYGLRDDINKISNFDSDYKPGDTLTMPFSFDEHAFVVKKGEKIRIDISSSAFPHYVPHTNNKGLFSEQTTAKVAENTVFLDGSFIEIPILT